ncbi:BgTH12-01995 [Blumeria graminis f. sp. triticale]|uniref:BgtE-5664 n=3 Tax=Blumeria graminis TaxID=34373 RepID=A0A381LJ79_BLUGR|nr:putative secreted effector protein [Blumeria graminis f. sp. tritici 96224]CAD6501746.1 BgTH12-01995 [Blumeria graminis f. sp. triticale]VDB84393.1 BgtE-5664 [Blumeria graminis f. sp. tritici]
MKTFQIASIIAGLGFLQPTVASVVNCGLNRIDVDHVKRVAAGLWRMKYESLKAYNNVLYPKKYEETAYASEALRKFPLFADGRDWNGGFFMYFVVSSQSQNVVMLFYEDDSGLHNCPLDQYYG